LLSYKNDLKKNTNNIVKVGDKPKGDEKKDKNIIARND
jgi:hypothetical protein